jgi:hypothetical protein
MSLENASICKCHSVRWTCLLVLLEDHGSPTQEQKTPCDSEAAAWGRVWSRAITLKHW